ncbi:MAG: CDP-alcohol phosphatidyltransferase family protein, partial [Candidatus Woesearchaeota archaeon]
SSALIFLIGKGVDAWMVYVILARELIITGLRSLVMRNGGSMPAKVSGKLKTVSQIIAILAVILNVQYAWYIMLVATIITIYSGLEYLWIERKALRDII